MFYPDLPTIVRSSRVSNRSGALQYGSKSRQGEDVSRDALHLFHSCFGPERAMHAAVTLCPVQLDQVSDR